MGKLYDIFASPENKKDKGIKKKEKLVDENFSIKSFFKLLKNRFGTLVTLNVITTLFLIPVILFILGVTGTFSYYSRTPDSNMFLVLDGISHYGESSYLDTLLTIFGSTSLISRNSVTSIWLERSVIIEFFIFGFLNVGFAYVLRECVRCNPVYTISDFFRTIKKNLKQGIIFGIIDLAVILLLIYDIYVYSYDTGEWLTTMFYYLSLLMSLIYFIMRVYIYQMIITFDLSIRKIIKNAFLFTFIGLKRHFVAILGTALVILLNYLLFSFTFTFSISIVLPFVLTIGICGLICVYAAYPQIKKHMIDPYYESIGKNPDDEDEGEDEEEPVFVDRG